MQLSEKKDVISREELQRKKRRRAKTRTAVIIIFIILILVIVLAILFKTTLFPIEEIMVSGNQTVTSAQILEASDISVGDKMFAISKSKVAKKITTQHPYIKTVKFEYVSSSKLKLVVTETEDVYCYKIGTSYYTADKDNKILSKLSTQPKNVIMVALNTKDTPKCGYTLKVDKDDFDLLNRILDYLAREKIEVNSIDVNDSNEISLKINNRFIVLLGSTIDLDGKLEHLRVMLPKIDAENGNDITGEINLRAWSSTKREGSFRVKTIN